ncbi:MAG TPA: CorA family divalent cation transporter [Jiangellaceae bacterium]
MDVIDGRTESAQVSSSTAAVCVLLPPASIERVREIAPSLGVDVSVAEQLQRSTHRRPLAQLDGRRISVVAFATDVAGRSIEVHVHIGERGVLVLGPEEATGAIREAVAPVDGEPEDGLAAVLLGFAHESEEAIQRLSTLALALDENTTGLTSSAERRAISRARAQLFSLQQLWAAHHQLLADDGGLIERLGEAARRRLHRARGLFESSATAAGQLYALLGDTLTRHATVINERLTLMAVVWLPLTVSTSFFGMNFGWMTAHIGSAASFVVLGIVLPLVLVVASVIGARWLTRE